MPCSISPLNSSRDFSTAIADRDSRLVAPRATDVQAPEVQSWFGVSGKTAREWRTHPRVSRAS